MYADIDAFIKWFQSNGGTVDLRVLGITEFPGSGRGAVALCDIPVRSPPLCVRSTDARPQNHRPITLFSLFRVF